MRYTQGQEEVPTWNPLPHPLDHALGPPDPAFPAQTSQAHVQDPVQAPSMDLSLRVDHADH